MVKTGGESLEKLEDMIVRAAESTAAHVRAAKGAIGAVIFGQDIVVERALVTVLSGGHALLVGVPGLAKTKLVDTMGVALGLDARQARAPFPSYRRAWFWRDPARPQARHDRRTAPLPTPALRRYPGRRSPRRPRPWRREHAPQWTRRLARSCLQAFRDFRRRFSP